MNHRVFITGDFHSGYDCRKFSTDIFPEQRNLSKDDIMFICGDIGIVWDGGKSDKYWQNWFEDKPWTTIAVPGNHENYDLIKELPIIEKFGAKCWKVNDSVFIAQRGEIATIDDYSYFLFGGARSHDKQWRTEYLDWWADEEPSSTEMEYGLQQLHDFKRKHHGFCPDYCITHDGPATIHEFLTYDRYDTKPYELTKYFECIDTKYNFCCWFQGHLHCDVRFDDSHIVLYNEIIELDENMHKLFHMDCMGDNYKQMLVQREVRAALAQTEIN